MVSNRSPLQLAIVRHADVDTLGHARLRRSPMGGPRLGPREGDADDLGPVPRGMDREAAPAAAHVEQAVTLLERQLRGPDSSLASCASSRLFAPREKTAQL